MATIEPQQTPEVAEVPESTPVAPSAPSKPIHTLVLDTGPLIKNDPPVSSLIAQAQELYTIPSVISEIKDADTRLRVETQLLPFVKIRSPKPDSVKFVTDFARRTGDLEVLSRPDLHLIALTYELECERNNGDWRLRKEPNQKRVNGKSPAQQANEEPAQVGTEDGVHTEQDQSGEVKATEEQQIEATSATENTQAETPDVGAEQQPVEEAEDEGWIIPTKVAKKQVSAPVIAQEEVTHQLNSLPLEPSPSGHTSEIMPNVTEDGPDDDDDEDGWITPSNVKSHLAKDQLAAPEQPIQRLLQVALLTSDYAMQNVTLRINLNLVSPSLARITRVKTWVLRCHGCFQVTRDMSKQFCPKCGQPTLTRVSCSTDQSGNFTIHLKKNFQWNKRGNVFSVPKPTHGTANGKYRGQGGGKSGWGNDLLLAEDQKEYLKQADSEKRTRHKDLMDEDYLPSILTGNRQGANGKIRVGAGRNINSKKRNA